MRLLVISTNATPNGEPLHEHRLRRGPEGATALSARHFVQDGTGFSRSPDDVILTGRINGILGAMRCRYIYRITRTRGRHGSVVWERPDPFRVEGFSREYISVGGQEVRLRR